jgi:hypothetical protein
LSGLVTDGTSGGVLPNIRVQIMDGAQAGRSTSSDATGRFSMADLSPGTVTVAFSATSYISQSRSVTISGNAQVDVVLERVPPPPVVNYAGVWTGTYRIDSCTDLDPAGLMPVHICGYLLRDNVFEFTLTQSGDRVAGRYRLVSYLISCPCAGDYGTFDMSGTVSPDGTLTVEASGIPRGSGLQGATMTFTLRQPAAGALTGSVDASLNLFGYTRATFRGSIVSGARTAP